jgi:hypothetical protein
MNRSNVSVTGPKTSGPHHEHRRREGGDGEGDGGGKMGPGRTALVIRDVELNEGN